MDRSQDTDIRGVKSSNNEKQYGEKGTVPQAPKDNVQWKRRVSAQGVQMLSQAMGADQDPSNFSNLPAAFQQARSPYRKVLVEYLQKHNPSKVGNVDALLNKYAGHEMDLFDKMYDKYGEPVIPLQQTLRQQTSASSSSREAKKSGNIFDKLTDTSKYTGAHKHRFDADGTGKGAAGRDYVSKGLGGVGGQTFSGSTKIKTDQQFKDSSEFLCRR